MSPFVVVLRKEVVDNARDRRSLSAALLFPLLGPLSLALMFVMLQDVRERASTPRVPVVGRAHAPALVAALERSGAVVVDAPADPVQAVRAGDVDVVVVLPDTFAEALRSGRTVGIEVLANTTRQASQVTARRVGSVLEHWGSIVGSSRLLARGVDPGLVEPLRVSVHDVGTADAGAMMVLAALPMFLLMGCFLGSTYIAIDVTAGERERGSLEALLMNPVRARDLVLAKLAAASLFGAASTVVTTAGFVVATRVIPFQDVDIDLHLPVLRAAGFVALLLPVVVLGAAVLVFVGTLSRSFKTAQAAISVVTLLPMVPAVLFSVFPQQPTAALVTVPMVGHSLLVDRLLRGEAPSALHVALATAGALGASVVFVVATARLFGPRLVAGR
jgi:sodium transport system permease protein